ncbi:hypothetical protein PMN64_08065 [Bradyrhizobium sp. UFLA01-814]
MNTKLAATPLRRATSVTFTLGANITLTNLALSSCDLRRRRSNSPKTSTRRAWDAAATRPDRHAVQLQGGEQSNTALSVALRVPVALDLRRCQEIPNLFGGEIDEQRRCSVRLDHGEISC